MKLYDIPAEIDLIEQALIENGGELTPEIEKRWADLLSQGRDKIEGAAMVVKRLEAEEEACKEEANRLRDRAGQFERNRESLKSLMIYAVNGLQGKIKTALFTIWTQRSAKQTKVEKKEGADLAELHKLHPTLVRVKYEPNIEALKVLADSEDGLPQDVHSFFTVTHTAGTEFLRIK